MRVAIRLTRAWNGYPVGHVFKYMAAPAAQIYVMQKRAEYVLPEPEPVAVPEPEETTEVEEVVKPKRTRKRKG